MEGLVSRIFSVDEMIPSAGQGILAVQGRKGEKIPGIEAVDCSDSRFAAKAERGFVRYLNGGCTSPVAAYAETSGNESGSGALLSRRIRAVRGGHDFRGKAQR